MKIKCDTCGVLFPNVPDWREHADSIHGGKAHFDIHEEPGDFKPNVKPAPKRADECKKILDNGWQVLLFANALGSYTAIASNPNGRQITTDDFEPSQSLFRITEKVLGIGDYE